MAITTARKLVTHKTVKWLLLQASATAPSGNESDTAYMYHITEIMH